MLCKLGVDKLITNNNFAWFRQVVAKRLPKLPKWLAIITIVAIVRRRSLFIREFYKIAGLPFLSIRRAGGS
jgi:hypothetical protein